MRFAPTQTRPHEQVSSSLSRSNRTIIRPIHRVNEPEGGSITTSSRIADFNLLRPYPTARLGIRPKLTVSSPGDLYEQEADRVADAVVAGGRPSVGHVSQGVQRRFYRAVLRPEDMADSIYPPGGEAGGEPSEAGAPEEVQRSASGEASEVGWHFEQSLAHSVNGGGQALPGPVRILMEDRLGWDFSGVRVHSDGRADVLARQVNARAFTLGTDIFFARSEYQPESRQGQHLLGHELTHVVQQADGQLSRQIQRQTKCPTYNGYNAGADVHSYNCAGLALRTYKFTSPASAVINEIVANFIAPETPGSGSCSPERVKFWLWEYDIKMEDDQGNLVQPTWQDFHIVAGRVDTAGNDPTNVYTKNGRRPVHGPGSGPSFKPPARDRATSNDGTEAPLSTPRGRPEYKERSNISEKQTSAECHP